MIALVADTPGTLTDRLLAAVAEEPGSTARELADDLGAEPAVVSMTLLKHVEHGRLTRQKTRGQWAYRVPSPA